MTPHEAVCLHTAGYTAASIAQCMCNKRAAADAAHSTRTNHLNAMVQHNALWHPNVLLALQL
jgi:hypothetical protein